MKSAQLRWGLLGIALLALAHPLLGRPALAAPPDIIPDTAPLDWEGDLADRMVSGIDRFLLNQIERAQAERNQFWKYDTSSPAAYAESVAGNRSEL